MVAARGHLDLRRPGGGSRPGGGRGRQRRCRVDPGRRRSSTRSSTVPAPRPAPGRPPTRCRTSPTSSSQPSVGVDAAGNAVAVWVSDAVDSQSAIAARTKDVAGAWSPIFPLSDPETGADDPEVAVTPNGRAAVVWAHYDTELGYRVIETASREFRDRRGLRRERSSTTTSDAQAPIGGGQRLRCRCRRVGRKSGRPMRTTRAVHAATRNATGDWSAAELVSDVPPTRSRTRRKRDPRASSWTAWAPRRWSGVVASRLLDSDPRTRTIETASGVAGDWTAPDSLGSSE